MNVLIYFSKEYLKPIGGPSGYLYNLNNGLKANNYDNINFIVTTKTKIKKIEKFIPKKVIKYYKKITGKSEVSVIDSVFSENSKLSKVDLNKYDIVHFHSTLSMYMVKDSLKDYKGIVVLTSHSPKVAFKEIIEDNTPIEVYKKNKKAYDKLEIIDEYAFNRADKIIFPCKYAEECYENTWDKFKNIRKKYTDKFEYLPSGLIPIRIDDNRLEIREKYNIPKNAFVICYLGRHNSVKGYDKLKLIGEKIINETHDIYFLIAGKESPITGLKSERWIEVGWTDKPHELANASDLFILPNKETFFDLVLLEMMSLGKTILLTNTGGNKYFKKFKNSGLFYYDYNNYEEACDIIKDLVKKDTKEIGLRNKKIFDKEFNSKIFEKNYYELMSKIYEEKQCN